MALEWSAAAGGSQLVRNRGDKRARGARGSAAACSVQPLTRGAVAGMVGADGASAGERDAGTGAFFGGAGAGESGGFGLYLSDWPAEICPAAHAGVPRPGGCAGRT